MNKILSILVVLLLISCKKIPQEIPTVLYEQKHPYGTVMYAKPDSLKVVISSYDPTDDTYKAYWREGTQYTSSWYQEEGFYGEAETIINISNE